ncbi:tetratricopeptide repeat protein [Rhodopseudomonas palustris]|uniref:tetratricopeptide repeat protein n=1 Tax=Rhodopseudomonas palustris TaxID=1076 RepID=UPI0021F33D88|nr:tetratricopeptide repeat protein [Rhodopseudomonas palustris]UYO46589.1 tetratricopeptide repeat protein [Rhodopseudomonas palustris]
MTGMNRNERRKQAKLAAKDGGPSQQHNIVQQWFAAAVQHHQQGRLAEAEALYRQVLNADARHADAWHLLGVLALQVGRNDIALEMIGKAIAINRMVAAYHGNRGLALDGLGRPAEALASYEAALAIEPRFAEAHCNRAAALITLGRLEDALRAAEAALRLRPDDVNAQINRGNALRDLGRLDEALSAYEIVLRTAPDNALAHTNRGIVLKTLGRLDEALVCYDAALQANPNLAEAHTNRGVTLKNLLRLDEALTACRTAIQLQPRSAEAHYNLATVLHDQCRLDDALAGYDQALALRPDFAMARWNRACILLSTARFEEGWREHEWRSHRESAPRQFPQPQWSGEAIAGRTLLLHAEQGLGDTLQFLRYVPKVAATGARIILAVPGPLHRLVAQSFPDVVVVDDAGALPAFDLHCPLLSLPLCFGTTLETIPADVPYLCADPAAVARWRERLGAGSRPKVGLVWAGNPRHANDRNRSIAFEQLAPLLDVAGIDWISLQVGPRRADLSGAPAGFMHDVADDLTDFAETAAAVSALDLIVSVDTAVAHLAAALARPVIMAIPFVPDWRWLLAREDSPWYPTVRLVRQTRPQDWDGVVTKLAATLTRFIET